MPFIPSEGPFYRRPLPNVCEQICFFQQTVGKNTLLKYVQTMFEKAGIPWKEQHRNISNHSGKVSCCTTLYDKGFDDQAIKMRSGHRSAAVQTLQTTNTKNVARHLRLSAASQTTSILYQPTSSQCET